MSNKQETVADISKEMRGITFGEECCPDCGADFQRSNRWIEFADRFEAAHQREVAELRACLKMAVVNARIARTCYAFGRECDNCGQACNARKWNKIIEATKGAKDGK